MNILRLAIIVFGILFASSITKASDQNSQESIDAPTSVSVAFYENKPSFFVNEQGELDGFDASIIRELAEMHNWEVDFVQLPNFKSLFDAVYDGEVDMAISSITITSDREKLYDFSQPYMNTGLGILVPSDERIGLAASVKHFFSSRSDLFIELLQIALAFLIFLIVFGFILYFTDEQRKEDANDDDGLTIREIFKGIYNSAWLAFTTASTIGYGDVFPKTCRARMAAVVCFLSGAILIGSITATITAFNVQKAYSHINSPHDLEGKTVATVHGTTSVIASRNYGSKVKTYDNIDQAVAAMILGNADAVVYDRPKLMHIANNQESGAIKVIDTIFVPQDYGIMLQSGSELIEDVNFGIRYLIEENFLDNLESQYFGVE